MSEDRTSRLQETTASRSIMKPENIMQADVGAALPFL